MKKYLFIIFCFIISSVYASDFSEESLVKGKVLDADGKQPLQYATVSLLNSKNDSIVDGTITDHLGVFKIKNVYPGTYNLKISFIGYKPMIINDVIVDSKKNSVDLGEIKLSVTSETIDEVEVFADQSPVTFEVDRKVIHVNQQDISSSGTAVNILENYPSVTVNIDGTVSLRGSSSFTVLVDNKPTVLDPSDVLNQIPASTIQSIEIITNPTAKYDSEGISGIINVMLKKNKLEGVSGLIKANGGMYKNYGGDFLVNFKKEKVNLFVDINLNNRGIEGKLKDTRRNNYSDTIYYVMSNGKYDRIRRSMSARGGMDFELDSSNNISLEVVAGNWFSGGKTQLDYESYTNPVSFNNNYLSKEEPSKEGNFYNVDINYLHNFAKKGHKISSLFYFDRRDLEDKTENSLSDYNNIISGTKSVESGPLDSYDFQIDYTLPFSSESKFEAGYKTEISNYNKQSEVYQYNTNVLDYELDSNYLFNAKYDKSIHSLYSSFSGGFNSLKYQLGLRAEYTNRSITQSNTNETNSIERIDYFPTVHFSYNLNENRQFMLSYTRRVRRPKDWQLEPFYTWKDAYNLRIGNPALKPQYINSYELSFINKWKNNSFSVDAYYRVTNNSIESIQEIIGEDLYSTTYYNIGSDKSLGAEIMLSMEIFRWWRYYLSGNIYNYYLEWEIENEEFTRESFNWTGRLYNTFKVGKTTRIQLAMVYNSPTVTVQGDNKGYFMTNASVRKEFFKDFSASLDVQGIFGFFERSKTYETDNFYVNNYIKPYTPIINLSVSYKIRNYKNNRKQKNLDMDNGEGSI